MRTAQISDCVLSVQEMLGKDVAGVATIGDGDTGKWELWVTFDAERFQHLQCDLPVRPSYRERCARLFNKKVESFGSPLSVEIRKVNADTIC